MKFDFDKMTRKFLLGESRSDDISDFLRALYETITNMSPKTQADISRKSISLKHLKEIRRGVRRMREKINLLEEQVKVLEESKNE